MAKELEYIDKIHSYKKRRLAKLWKEKLGGMYDNDQFWTSGKLLEYAILRAFELEGAEVTYPYSLYMSGEQIEQIDGAIHVGGLHILVEAKDYKKDNPIDIEPIAKLKAKLDRRYAGVLGCFFSMSGFTGPASTLVQYMNSRTIILWDSDDVNYCMEHHCFIDCLIAKFRMAVEKCEHEYRYAGERQLITIK